MARMISLDIGFDREGLDNPRRSGECPLQLGFTKVDQLGNPIEIARRLKRNDHLLFTLYDLTDHCLETSPVDTLSFRIAFQRARIASPSSPVAEPVYERFAIFPGPCSPGYSTVFEQKFPNWNVHRPREGSRAYPGNQLVFDDPEIPRTSLVLEHPGHFYFSLSLYAAWPEGVVRKLQLFQVDPEIILSNDGPGDDGKPPEPPPGRDTGPAQPGG